MERLWNRIESMSVNEAIKKNVFLALHTIIWSLFGLVLWFCIRWIACDSIQWAVCFWGYTGFFGFMGGVFFLWKRY